MQNYKFKNLKIGLSARFEKKITSNIIKNFIKISGDNNAIHIDPKFAKKYNYKKNIGHGMVLALFYSILPRPSLRCSKLGSFLSYRPFRPLKDLLIRLSLCIRRTMLTQGARGDQYLCSGSSQVCCKAALCLVHFFMLASIHFCGAFPALLSNPDLERCLHVLMIQVLHSVACML